MLVPGAVGVPIEAFWTLVETRIFAVFGVCPEVASGFVAAVGVFLTGARIRAVGHTFSMEIVGELLAGTDIFAYVEVQRVLAVPGRTHTLIAFFFCRSLIDYEGTAEAIFLGLAAPIVCVLRVDVVVVLGVVIVRANLQK